MSTKTEHQDLILKSCIVHWPEMKVHTEGLTPHFYDLLHFLKILMSMIFTVIDISKSGNGPTRHKKVKKHTCVCVSTQNAMLKCMQLHNESY